MYCRVAVAYNIIFDFYFHTAHQAVIINTYKFFSGVNTIACDYNYPTKRVIKLNSFLTYWLCNSNEYLIKLKLCTYQCENFEKKKTHFWMYVDREVLNFFLKLFEENTNASVAILLKFSENVISLPSSTVRCRFEKIVCTE